MTLLPTTRQLETLAGSDDSAPVIMLNLLRFKDRADGVDAADEITGAEAYARYAEKAAPHLERAGGKVLMAMAVQQSVIGPADSEWDLVLAVRYPSRAAFMAMATDPDYLLVHTHREAALADSRLIACAAVPI